MRIIQGYVSKSIMDFPFHEIYKLDDYNDSINPCVFFGMYRYEDYQLMFRHAGEKKIFWTGQDAIDFDFKNKYHCNNVTAHKNIYKLITNAGHPCELVRPSTFLNEVNPQRLGNKIYAYCPSAAKEYHGSKVLEELSRAGYEITIGDGQFSQKDWRNGRADFFYKDVFVGLCLSEFAGGGTSIIEMGLRGIPVITNVFNLPHCIPWENTEGIANTIESYKVFIGQTLAVEANQVWQSLDHEHKWLEI